MLLSTINSPEDIKKMSYNDLNMLSREIRDTIINTVNVRGGHLASNLGVVEITLALHRAFNAPKDKLIFDVGHQVYAHKLITGRLKEFNTLRSHNGLSGFPRYSESEYDSFEVGHASTSISAALGMARSRDLSNDDYNVVAVVGDGALTGGMCYEALNDAGLSNSKLIVLLNDNEMSISKNVGALSSYLSKIRISAGYRLAKKTIRKGATAIPIIGPFVHGVFHTLKNLAKKFFIKENFFSPLGFHYLGPIDGHDICALEKILVKAKSYNSPVLIHCCTKKGYGFSNAEKKPEDFHGVAPTKNPNKIYKSAIPSGRIAVLNLIKEMEKDDKIVVVTAAMASGTYTELIKNKFPTRFFDVGIAEEHAVTMCAGLAKTGMKPYFFVYSTFFQRCFDQVFHDVYLQKLPIRFFLDRSGLSGEDGVTHHGIYDIGMISCFPDFKIMSPSSNKELADITRFTVNLNEPCVVRYPKSLDFDDINYKIPTFEIGKWHKLLHGDSCTILAMGSMVYEVLKGIDLLKEKNISVTLYNCSSVCSVDNEVLKELSLNKSVVLTVEEHILDKGFGNTISYLKNINDYKFELKLIGITNSFIQHGNRGELLKDAGIDYKSIANVIIETMHNRGLNE